MRFDIITIFPELFQVLDYGIVGRAQTNNLINLHYWNPRDYTTNKHRRVDDRSYGGGPGMVMQAQPLHDTITAARENTYTKSPGHGTPCPYRNKRPDPTKTRAVLLSPQGKPLTQQMLNEAAKLPNLLLVSGRYEGIDERVIELDIDEEWSLGDYILSGGELAALVVIDAITRLLPGALGDEDSAKQDSFMAGLLDHPHYTRPELFCGQKVPNVLLNGAHEKIAEWRLQQALGRTMLRRPDLLEKYELTEKEQKLLTEFLNQQKR